MFLRQMGMASRDIDDQRIGSSIGGGPPRGVPPVSPWRRSTSRTNFSISIRPSSPWYLCHHRHPVCSTISVTSPQSDPAPQLSGTLQVTRSCPATRD
ncbi:MAG: hypothetical protein Ct9H300mP1_03930 [Planctomycetaceae bacterium]|nr:MAG: hypothetical protein Ct9H300mP1_03930 [Planctomycetaceae bacterium]